MIWVSCRWFLGRETEVTLQQNRPLVHPQLVLCLLRSRGRNEPFFCSRTRYGWRVFGGTRASGDRVIYDCRVITTVTVIVEPSLHAETMDAGSPSPRKRHRKEMDLTAEAVLEIPKPDLDPVYYIHGADCTLLIGNTLFKAHISPLFVCHPPCSHLLQVHRFLLTRDGSTFENMFTLPSNGGAIETQGLSDDNPIVLHDDPDEFRALCWALYALWVPPSS